MVFQPGVFQPNAFQGADSQFLRAVESGQDKASITAVNTVTAVLAVVEAGADVAAISATSTVVGALAAQETGADIAVMTGDSAGAILVLPRVIEGGLGYLVEIEAYDPVSGGVVTHCFSSLKLSTLPSDTLPNRWFDDRLDVPGDYTRAMFSDGTTAGAIDVGVGVVRMHNNDGGVDGLLNHAFDGYTLTIRSVERERPRYANAVTVFRGTVEQIEMSWGAMEVRLRDRLAELDKPLQTVKFAGTTIAGGMNEAEGKPDDLKDQPKPLCYGAPMCIPAVASNTFDNIFDVGQNGLQGVFEVRDKGVALPATGNDYGTVALLRAATIAGGRYSSCRAAGLIRTGSTPAGQITVAPLEGTNAGARTAAQIARRMLLRMGKVEGVDFLAADVAALDALNSAPLGYWIGSEDKIALDAIGEVLNSIGATILPDRFGVYRMYRMEEPNGPPVMTLTLADILETNARGIERLATGDQGKGVPSWKVTMQWGRNYSVMRRSELDNVNTPESFKSFAELEWRSAVAEDATVKTIHKLASELTFESYFTVAADAQAEAARRLVLYKTRRDRFKVPVPSYYVEELDLAAIVRLRIPRFGLDDGKLFRVIGMAPNLQTKITTLDLWG